MELIIGGAYQGKKAYAEKKYPEIHIVDGKDADPEDILAAECVNAFHLWIRKCLKEDKNLSELISRICYENPDVILICDEVGYGVVPMDAFERKYREQVGRVMTELAKGSKSVTRVICGIGTEIYHA